MIFLSRNPRYVGTGLVPVRQTDNHKGCPYIRSTDFLSPLCYNIASLFFTQKVKDSFLCTSMIFQFFSTQIFTDKTDGH
ncbi:hypothetical protein LR066_03510, partial [candidate division WOR-3 bacterium]|nr:hypothetical protein [candidate division WOR-3 bacterium]